MTTPDQLRTIIRFGLEQLRIRNAHHEFEHLCRHLARARICSNILPSTGPVSAGGDHGRDFETFRTYIEANAAERSIFAALASSARLAFACTLQRERLDQKIRTDISTICSSGFSVSNIHVFFVEDLPTAKRNSIQEWARKKHAVEVDFYDGNAISELLIDADTFWIASRYLEIPAEQFPRRLGDRWYEELSSKVRGEERRCEADGQFLELKHLARHATTNEILRSDLPEWISRLATTPRGDRRLWRAAAYEIFVASLRGMNTMEGQENRIQDYFSDINHLVSPAELKDAACLLSYCLGALARNALQLNVGDIIKWRAELTRRTEALLAEATGPNAICTLLDVRWFLAISPSVEAKRARILDDGFPWLEQLVQHVANARMFPLSNLIDNLTGMQSFIEVSDVARYQAITAGLDAALSVREGDQAVAEKLRNRAVAFGNNNRPLVALKFIHDANVKWFSHETLSDSLLAQLALADIYNSLGLCKAAQYFGLGQAYIALASSTPGIRAMASRGLFAAAGYAYGAGEWLRFVDLAELALRAHAQFAPTPGDIDRHPWLLRTASSAACVVALLEKLDSVAAPTVLRRIDRWNLGWLLDDMLKSARASVSSITVDRTWDQLQQQFHGRPMVDVGHTRRYHWRQLGVSWRFRWLNRHKTVAVAEQLVATLQIVLADLAEEDLCLLPATVTARVRCGPLNLIREPSNVGSRWILSMPADMSSDDAANNTVVVVAAILHELSVLPTSAFMSIIEERFKAGLSSKVFIARPYAELLHSFLLPRVTKWARRSLPVQADRTFKQREHPDFAWRDDLGPYYPKDEISDWLSRRYAKLIGPIREIILSLRADPGFQITLAALRATGWRDWHVLNAIYSIALNYRVQECGCTSSEGIELVRVAFDKSDAVAFGRTLPRELFTEKSLREAQYLNMLSTLTALGHELHQETPSFRAIARFLGKRYRYWSDDVEHADPFAAPL